jgi:hypothetical protein
MDNNLVLVKKKKGRPRKIQLEPSQDSETICEQVVVEKKKRGRKKKEQVEEVVKQKKKRGRKAAVKFFSSSIRKRIPLTTVIQDNDKSILHLDIKDTDVDSKKELYNLIEDSSDTIGYETELISECAANSNDKILIDKDRDPELKRELESSPLIDLYEKRLQARIIQDNKLIDRLENIHNEEELLEELQNNNLIEFVTNNQEDSLNRSRGHCHKEKNTCNNMHSGYFNILNDFIENNEWLDRTDVCCWWCCHSFNTIPVGLPIDYDKNQSKKFIVKGIFCSFACMIAYGQNDRKKDEKFKSLTNFLYKKITGGLQVVSKESYKCHLNSLLKDDMFGSVKDENTKLIRNEYIDSLANLVDSPLKPAPPRCALKMFGGRLTIDEFRNSTKERKIYKMIEYPMSISRDYVEEVDLENIKHINMNVFSGDKKKDHEKRNNVEELKLHEIRMDKAKTRVVTTDNENNNIITNNNNINKFITF